MTLDHRIEIVEGAERPVLRKWALTPPGNLALQREADRLERARHPGVVVLAGAADDHIDLEWAGAETLALARLTRGSIAQILTMLATTVADLHDRGIVHGRIDETHVVIGPELQPRLCGLRGPDPGQAEPGPADDVEDLGLLLQRALGMGADNDVIPEHRWRTWPRSGGRDRGLELICERATDPDPARRPTARALARSLGELVPDIAVRRDTHSTEPPADLTPAELTAPNLGPTSEPEQREAPDPEPAAGERARPSELAHHPPARAFGARLMAKGSCVSPGPAAVRVDPADRNGAPTPPDDIEPPRQHREAATRNPLLLRVAMGLGLLALAGAALTFRQPASRVTDPTPGTASTAPGRATITGTAAGPETSSQAPRTATGLPGSVDRTVEFAGATYEVGEVGDRPAVADWDCDGTATVGLVRPSTGEVFLFDGWPGAAEVSIRPRARIAGAQDLVGTPPGNGCQSPMVRLADGSTVALNAETGG